MKTLLFHAVLYLGLISSMWGQSLPEIKDILRKEDGHVVLAKLIKDAPDAKREELLAMIVQIVRDDLAKPQVVNMTDDRVTTYAAYALVAAGAEQAMLDAFKDNLDNTRPGEFMSIVESLSACRGEQQVAFLERLARDRLGILGDTLVVSQDEDEGRARADLLGTFARILMKLASSANPTGMARAKKIRDEFAVLYPSENGKRVLAAIDGDLAKIPPRQPTATKLSGTMPPDRPFDGKFAPPPKVPEARSVASAGEPLSSTPRGVIVALIVAVGCFLWFLVKRCLRARI